MMKIHRYLLAAALSAATWASAADKPDEVVNAGTRESFEKVAADVRAEMQPGGRYQYVEPGERATIDKSFAEMDAVFRQHATVAEMGDDDKVKLFNAQGVVNAIITRRDRDRVICEKRPRIGSNLPVTTCLTYGELQEKREISRKKKYDLESVPCKGGRRCTAN